MTDERVAEITDRPARVGTSLVDRVGSVGLGDVDEGIEMGIGHGTTLDLPVRVPRDDGARMRT